MLYCRVSKISIQNKTDLIIGAYEQALMLQKQINYLGNTKATNDTQTNINLPITESESKTVTFQVDNNEELQRSANEQAKMLQEQIEHNYILDEAKKYANELLVFNERADLINGAEEQAKILLDESNKNEQKPKIYEVIDRNDRYGNIVSPSKPIKLGKEQMENLLFKINKDDSHNYSKKKEMLNSLKEQLQSPELDFLKYNENVVNVMKAA